MQDHFLFDDADPKQRGKGCDRLGTKKDDHLAVKWTWDKNGKKGKPRQCCYAALGKGWALEVIFWHSCYEAGVTFCGDSMITHNIDRGGRGVILVTRVQAQLKAEQLLLDLWDELDGVIRKKGILAKKAVRALLTGKKGAA